MTKKAKKKKKVSDILLKNGVALVKEGVIPVERLRKQYRVELFDERACKRCNNRPYRPNDLCEACPALMGRYNFMKEVKTKSGKRYAVPSADLAWLKAACDTEPTINDKRVMPPLRNKKLKFTGKLFGPNAIDEEGNPRANQRELIKQWKSNGCCGTIVAPPRTGKTVIGAAIVCDVRVRTLWIADRFELLDQAYATFMGDEEMGRAAVTNAPDIQSNKKKKNAVVHIVKNLKELETTTADVVLINPQKGYLERNMKRFAKAIEGKFGLVIVDEVHGANAARYAQFVSHVDAPMRLGLSATPGRKDGRDRIMQFTVGPITARTRTTTLLPTIHAAFSKSMPKTNYSSWSPAMAWVAQDKVRNQEIVDLVFKDLKEGHRSIIVPVNYKAHMTLLVDMINKEAEKRGMPRDLAVALHAKADRQKVLQRANSLKRRTVTVAIMSIVKQGVDVKACSSVIVVIPMSATQGVGAPTFRQLSYRCATPFVGKNAPKVTLLVDNANMLRGCIRGLFWQEIVPRLSGKEVSYKVDKRSSDLLSKMTVGGRAGGPRNGSWTR